MVGSLQRGSNGNRAVICRVFSIAFFIYKNFFASRNEFGVILRNIKIENNHAEMLSSVDLIVDIVTPSDSGLELCQLVLAWPTSPGSQEILLFRLHLLGWGPEIRWCWGGVGAYGEC